MYDTTPADTHARWMTLPPPLDPRSPDAADEANHRIANNLHMLSTLITSEARGISDPAAREVLELTRARISAIGSLHRLLCMVPAQGRVDLRGYLQGLCVEMARNLPCHRPLPVRCARISCRPETARALGLLVVELVTNACKHAYRAEMPGPVAVSLAMATDGGLCLTVEDRGRGRRPGSSNLGLGSRLIEATVRQLAGRAEWQDARPGTRFSLHFKLPGG